eukprot:6924720-Alexandrium_andersonii.AAC.1
MKGCAGGASPGGLPSLRTTRLAPPARAASRGVPPPSRTPPRSASGAPEVFFSGGSRGSAGPAGEALRAGGAGRGGLGGGR